MSTLLTRYGQPEMHKVEICRRINNLKLYCLDLPEETLLLLDAGYEEKSVCKKDHNFSEKLSFGGQEMSGNVGKYGETQAQICPHSQQTLKV